jgi:hypothetical protein
VINNRNWPIDMFNHRNSNTTFPSSILPVKSLVITLTLLQKILVWES